MSVAELPGRDQSFDRTPPHDLVAEQCVLGGMLLSPEAIAEVIEILRTQDFYRPAHQIVYDAIIDLYGRGEPADAVTLSNELTKRGELARVGGAPYLHTLIEAVPTAANAGYYAKIVRERSILRRLVEVGTRIAQLGYSAEGQDADELLDRAQAEVYGIADRRAGEDYAALSDIMPATLDEIEAISSRGGQMVGVPTGFSDLDALTNGLHPGQLVVVAARPAMGKALALDTPLPTPTGWTTMGAVRVGDHLLDANGRPTRVVAATEVMTRRPCYQVTFDDGTTVIADADHQWVTEAVPADAASAPPAVAAGSSVAARVPPAAVPGGRSRVRPPASVKTTREIAATSRPDAPGGRLYHRVATTAPLDLPRRSLPVSPYALGLRLGEPDPPARARSGSADPLRDAGVRGERHIPQTYLRGSIAQRRALLAGLLNAGGTVAGDGTARFTTTHRRLADGVRELVVGLGYRCEVAVREVPARVPAASTAYTVAFTAHDGAFPPGGPGGPRPARPDRGGPEPARTIPGPAPTHRVIVDVREVDSVPVRCVQVDNPDHLYLATRSMIPTHNSTLALDFARAASIKHQLTSVIFSLEMSRNEITMRLLSAEARVGLHAMRSGLMNDDDWTRLARRMSEVAEAPLFIDDSPNMSMMEIRAKCRRLKQRHDLRLVIVDYLQLMSSNKRVESRQVEVSEFSRTLKLLAKELEVPVVALSQLNRGPEQRTDKKPMVSDLRESGCLTADTRVLRADTGAEVPLGALLASGERDVPVWSVDDNLRLVRRTMTHAFPNGTRPVFTLHLESGRKITATANHPFLTYDGWRPLGELGPGSRLAVPRRVPAPRDLRAWSEPEVILLAHLLGSGSPLATRPIRYVGEDDACRQAVADAAAHVGVAAVPDEDPVARAAALRLVAPPARGGATRDPIAAWLEGLGLFGRPDHETFLPARVFALPTRQAALFLRHLWASGGGVRWDDRRDRPRIRFTAASRRLIDDVARLLLRFGVMTRITTARGAGARPTYRLDVDGADDRLRFLTTIGTYGVRAARVAQAAQAARRSPACRQPTSPGTVPHEVWDRIRAVLADDGAPPRAPRGAGTRLPGGASEERATRPERLGRVAAILDEAQMEMLATNDVSWDTVVSIESRGEQPVYDATVLGTHNFIADGIVVHNSIEQDADVVILLHREDAYEKESPRAGEADLIVAKHRNGPTATVTVAFQGHYSRFVDMAPG